MPDSEIESLKSALNYWEWVEYISTAIVFIGCVGEFVAEFTSLPKSKESENKLARLSLIVLILGIAGELLGTVRTSQLSGQLIANIEERTGNAEKKAGEADERASVNEKEAAMLRKQAAGLQKSAEDERMARIELEGKVEWRRLSKANQDSLRRSMSSFKGVVAAVPYSDMEGDSFASDIASSLRAAGLQVYSPGWAMVGRVPSLNGPIEKGPTGIDISTTADVTGVAAGKAIHDKLESFGFDVSPPRINPATLGKSGAPQIWVSVYSRPEGPQGEAKLRIAAKTKKQQR